MFSVFIAPEYSFRNLQSKNEELSNYIRARDSFDKGDYRFSLGALLSYSFKKNFGFQTGIVLSNKGERTSYRIINDTLDIEGNFINSYRFISLPLNVSYIRRTEGKLAYGGNAGVSCNFLYNTQVILL